MFGSFIFLSGIALFASAVAHPISSPPTTPTLFEVVVGSLEGNTTYTPPYIVSQVRLLSQTLVLMPFHSDGRTAWGCGIIHLLSQEPYRDPILVLFPLRRIGRRYRHWFVSSDLLWFLFLSLTRSWYSTHAVEEGQAVNGSFSFNVTSVSI